MTEHYEDNIAPVIGVFSVPISVSNFHFQFPSPVSVSFPFPAFLYAHSAKVPSAKTTQMEQY